MSLVSQAACELYLQSQLELCRKTPHEFKRKLTAKEIQLTFHIPFFPDNMCFPKSLKRPSGLSCSCTMHMWTLHLAYRCLRELGWTAVWWDTAWNTRIARVPEVLSVYNFSVLVPRPSWESVQSPPCWGGTSLAVSSTSSICSSGPMQAAHHHAKHGTLPPSKQGSVSIVFFTPNLLLTWKLGKVGQPLVPFIIWAEVCAHLIVAPTERRGTKMNEVILGAWWSHESQDFNSISLCLFVIFF